MDKDEIKSSIENIVEDLELAVSDRKISRIVNKILEYKYESDITFDELYEDIMDIFPNEKEDDSIIEFAEEVAKMAIDKIQECQDSDDDDSEEED
jgi:hypothetical protein